MNPLFALREVAVCYGSTQVLGPVSLAFSAGEFVSVAGPNGAGKSTLLSVLAGLVAPSSGSCEFLHQQAHQWNRRSFAQRVAVVQQVESPSFPFTAEQVVYMGRMPHRARFTDTAEDDAAVEQALASTGTLPFRHREFRTLSGGEKQRILLAAALAQTPEVLLLDEPSTHLDLHHQVSLHQMLRRLSKSGMLVVAVTHDLNLAAAYSDRMVVLHHGTIQAEGTPTQVLRSSLMEEVFQVHVQVHTAASGHPWLVYGE